MGRIQVDILDNVTSDHRKPLKDLSQYILLSPSSRVLCRAKTLDIANSQMSLTMVVNLHHIYSHCVCVCTCMCMHVCMCMFHCLPVCVCVCVCVCLCVSVRLCVCLTHENTQSMYHWATVSVQRHSHRSDTSNNSLPEINRLFLSLRSANIKSIS